MAASKREWGDAGTLVPSAPMGQEWGNGDSWQVMEEEVFENQRWNISGGWGPQFLLLFDREGWSDRAGRPRRRHTLALPEGWTWSDTQWSVDTMGLGCEGWAYGVCFEGVGQRRVGSPGQVDFTRWRRWIRRRQRPVGIPEESSAVLQPAGGVPRTKLLAGSLEHGSLDLLWGGHLAHHASGGAAQPPPPAGGWGLASASVAPALPPGAAAPSTPLQRLLYATEAAEEFAEPEYLCCIITGEMLGRPLVAMTSGHTYEGSVLAGLVYGGDACPMTRAALGQEHLVPNHTLSLALLQWRRYLTSAVGGGALPPTLPPAPTPPPPTDDWLLVVPVHPPGEGRGAGEGSAGALTTISAEATAPPSEGVEPPPPPPPAAVHSVTDALTAALRAPVPAFLVCPLDTSPSPQPMLRPVITWAGWTYEEAHLKAHFAALAAAAAEGVPLAGHTDPITGMALPRERPAVPNVALADAVQHWHRRQSWLRGQLSAALAEEGT